MAARTSPISTRSMPTWIASTRRYYSGALTWLMAFLLVSRRAPPERGLASGTGLFDVTAQDGSDRVRAEWTEAFRRVSPCARGRWRSHAVVRGGALQSNGLGGHRFAAVVPRARRSARRHRRPRAAPRLLGDGRFGWCRHRS